MTNPVVTDDGVVELIAKAIHADRQEWLKPQYRQAWETATAADEALALSHARAALAASDRDVLVGRIAELEAALVPFKRVAAITDAAGLNSPDDMPCVQFFPRIWPTLGDCRKARAALLPLAGEV